MCMPLEKDLIFSPHRFKADMPAEKHSRVGPRKIWIIMIMVVYDCSWSGRAG